MRLAVFAVAALPWWWFAVRDAGPWADAASIFLPAFLVPAALCVVVALVRRQAASLAVAVSWLLFAAVTIAGPWMPVRTPAPPRSTALRIVAANVLGANHRVGSVTDDLVAARPDLLVVSEDHPDLDRRLRAHFAHAATSGTGGRGTGVYTDVPMRALPLPPAMRGLRAVRARIDGPGGPFVLYALHLPRPWPRPTADFEATPTGYRAIVRRVVQSIGSESLPVVVAGDLNLVDRMPEYRAMASSLRDAMLTSWGGPTSLKWWPLLARIDHVLVDPSWCATDAHRIRVVGSDHRANVVTIGPCAGGRA